jgi:MFS family permease
VATESTTGEVIDEEQGWLNPGVRGIGAASLLSDAGHEVPTSLLPAFLTSTVGAPASALGLIEGISDGLAGAARLGGGALADDPHRRRATAVGGYTSTAVLSGLIGVASSAWQVGVLRAGAWFSRGLRVPARNALLADTVPAPVYGRAYGFERAMDNLGVRAPGSRDGLTRSQAERALRQRMESELSSVSRHRRASTPTPCAG